MDIGRLVNSYLKSKVFRVLVLLFFIFFVFFRAFDSRILFTDSLLIEDASYGFSLGEWIVNPEIEGRVDLAKPPFFYWINSVPYLFFGYNPIFRNWLIPIVGLLTAILTFKLARVYFDKKTSYLSALFLIANLLFLFFTKTANFDLPNAFLITLSIFFYLKIKKGKFKSTYLSPIMIIGFLTRSFLYLFTPIIIFFDHFVLGGGKLKTAKLVNTFFVFLFFAAIWLIASFSLNPEYFYNQFIKIPFSYHAYGKILGDESTPIFYYLIIFILAPQLLFGLYYAVRVIIESKKSYPDSLIVFWFFLVFVTLSLSETKHLWYILPVLSPLSILSARGYFDMTKNGLKGFKKIVIDSFLFIFILVPLAYLVIKPFPEANIVSAAKEAVAHSGNERIIYLWRYSLLPETRFFPGKEISVTNQIDENIRFLLIKNRDIPEIGFDYSILYSNPEFSLLKFEK